MPTLIHNHWCLATLLYLIVGWLYMNAVGARSKVYDAGTNAIASAFLAPFWPLFFFVRVLQRIA